MIEKNSPTKNWKLLQLVTGEILKEFDLHFSNLNINYMPIKGAFLINSGLSEKIVCRRMDDIDILVLQKDFDRVCAYFSSLPQVVFVKHKWYFEQEFFYSWGNYKSYVEIHWLLNYPERFLLPTEDLFRRAKAFSNSPALRPSHEDSLLLLLCHAHVHIGFELRETIREEIALLSGQEGFSWDKFWKYAHPTGIELFIKLLLSHFSMDAACNHAAPKGKFIIFLLRPLLSAKRYAHLPQLVKRLLFEIPFARKPWRLILNKMILSRHGSNATSVNLH